MNTLNTGNIKLANIHREALAISYAAMGASTHQMPRNIMPMQTLVARTLQDANGAEMTVNEIAAHLRGVGFHVNLNSLHQALFQLSKRSAIRKNGVRKGVRYSW